MEQSIDHYYGQLYQALIDKITAADIGIKHFDMWTQQTLSEADSLPFNRPAVLFDFRSLTPQRLGGRRYAVFTEIDIHLITDVKGNVSARPIGGPSETIRKHSLQYLLLQDKLLKTLDGYNSSEKGIGSLSWIGTQTDTEQQNIIETIITFKTRLVCDAATTKYREVNPEVNITISIEEL